MLLSHCEGEKIKSVRNGLARGYAHWRDRGVWIVFRPGRGPWGSAVQKMMEAANGRSRAGPTVSPEVPKADPRPTIRWCAVSCAPPWPSHRPGCRAIPARPSRQSGSTRPRVRHWPDSRAPVPLSRRLPSFAFLLPLLHAVENKLCLPPRLFPRPVANDPGRGVPIREYWSALGRRGPRAAGSAPESFPFARRPDHRQDAGLERFGQRRPCVHNLPQRGVILGFLCIECAGSAPL